jgi:hypothetical protein
MTFNKTIQTNVVEQIKTVLIVALVVGIGAFVLGVNYQKNSTVTVENKVVVESAVTPVETADVKK